MQFQYKTSFLHQFLFFFLVKLLCRWTETLIGPFEALILSFKILFSILSTLLSSAKSEYDGRDMFSSFIQYKWSSYAKLVADQLKGVLHVTVGSDSVTVVDVGRGTT